MKKSLFNKDALSKVVEILLVEISINVSWASNHHIRIISEESCDTEDWRNDAENSALINYI